MTKNSDNIPARPPPPQLTLPGCTRHAPWEPVTMDTASNSSARALATPSACHRQSKGGGNNPAQLSSPLRTTPPPPPQALRGVFLRCGFEELFPSVSLDSLVSFTRALPAPRAQQSAHRPAMAFMRSFLECCDVALCHLARARFHSVFLCTHHRGALQPVIIGASD